jgi:hypothetical protein
MNTIKNAYNSLEHLLVIPNQCVLLVISTMSNKHGRYVSPLLQATKALRESTGIAVLCFLTSALEGGEGSASRPDKHGTNIKLNC